jgi:hypothetical protein
MEAHGFSATIGKRVRDLEARKAELAGRLAEARLQTSHPLSTSWEECQTLASALNQAADPEDARLRLRTALRRVISEM